MWNFLRNCGGLFANRGGNVAMIFALSALPITVFVGGSIDLSRMRVERTKLQSAVDAASLAATQLPANATDAQIKATIDSFIAANFDGYGHVNPSDTTFDRDGTAVEVWATANVPMTFAGLLGYPARPVNAHAKAERGGTNVELALALDVTQSMSLSGRLSALKVAAKDLIDTIVATQQPPAVPYYTRVAIAPWSDSVNVSSSSTAQSLRGAIDSSTKSISGAAGWSSGSAWTITAASKGNPVRITLSANHGVSSSAPPTPIYITGVNGMVQLNNRTFMAVRVDNNKFDLYEYDWTATNGVGAKVNGGGYSTFQSGSTPRAQRCVLNGCVPNLTVNSHGYQVNDKVYITGLGGSLGTLLNNNWWTVTARATNTMVLGDAPPAPYSYSSPQGTLRCADPGCQYYGFVNVDGDRTLMQITNCVSERVGANAYTDVSPSTAGLGRVYSPSTSDCTGQTFMPMTSNRTTLKGRIDALTTNGSTAGQIGAAWAWYMLSPNFETALGNNVADYNAEDTMKVAVLMTDGEFNTGYCNGVVSSESGYDPLYGWVVPGSQRNSCTTTNGNPFQQAASICAAMKQAGIIVYTVGFGVGDSTQVVQTLSGCASDPSYAHLASTSQQLSEAFKAIGTSITRLRLSR